MLRCPGKNGRSFALAGVLSVLCAAACGGTDGRGEIIDDTDGATDGGDIDAASSLGAGGGQDDAAGDVRLKDASKADGGQAGSSLGDDAGADGGASAVEAGGPVCGNGIVEPGEDCDDGNTLDGDGCSSTCLDSKCCEACEDANCPINNARDPVSNVLTAYPSCDAFLDAETAQDGNAQGTKKKDLCYAVAACVERTRCATEPRGIEACYCGSTPIASCNKTPTGPCRMEIDDGSESTDPSQVLLRLTKVKYGAGAALSRAQCAHDFCTTLNDAHFECYRPPGTRDPYPACDMFGVDAGTDDDATGAGGSGGASGASGMSGDGGASGMSEAGEMAGGSGAGGSSGSVGPDAALDARADQSAGTGGSLDASIDAPVVSEAAADVFAPDAADAVASEAAADAKESGATPDAAGSNICATGKHPPSGTVCTDCEAGWCPHDATGCSAGTCAPTSYPACSDYPLPADQTLCQATLDCARKTDCAAAGISTCYCGTQSPGNCRGGLGDGLCKAEIVAGMKTTNSNTILDTIANPALPAGGAMKLVLCDHDFCGSQNNANNECMPYCQ